MLINFRQGIIGYQNLPKYININGDNIGIDTSKSPIMLSFSHGQGNYLYTESVSIPTAWIGPFDTNITYWLYWDIDLITADRTFGYTTLLPLFGSTFPSTPA